jgi:hypothetical protein
MKLNPGDLLSINPQYVYVPIRGEFGDDGERRYLGKFNNKQLAIYLGKEGRDIKIALDGRTVYANPQHFWRTSPR